MNDRETKKAEAVKKCLLSVQRLGMDMAGLLPFLGSLEKQLLQGAYDHLDHVVTGLNGILRGQEAEMPVQKQEQEKKRPRGSVRL